MEIEVLGAWGELLGGISGLVAALGVIATLLYLARQIQQNTRAVQSTNFSTWINATNAVHSILIDNADLHEDALAGSRELNPEEFWRFHFWAVQWF
jgi:hypothetical protein